MSQSFLPEEVSAALGAYFTCEMTTVNTKGQPITWPCLAHFDAKTGQILLTASIAFRVKAVNARKYPKVSLLYSDPTGSGLTDPPAILIQGTARVEELLEYTSPRIIQLFRVTQQRQPDSKKFLTNRIMRRLFRWYLFQRLVIEVTPQRVRFWPRCNFYTDPTEIQIEANYVE